jgi:hypothetical protein
VIYFLYRDSSSETPPYDDPKVKADASIASHRVKHGILEDGYNRRWQAIVNPGKWITTDESRVAGWYHSVMT